MLKNRMMMAVILGAAMSSLQTGMPLNAYSGQKQPEPNDKGRRAEKNAAALAKAEEKRKRRALKRVGSNIELTGLPLTESEN